MLLSTKMEQKHRRGKNKKLIERFSATFIMVVVCLVVLIPSVSALEFDNVKSYDPETKTVTITNAFGLGDEIGKATLNTPINMVVGRGYQKVAEFDIWAYEDYNEALKQFTFEDMKNGRTKINRDYDLKYLTWEEVEVDDYRTECYDGVGDYPGETRVCDNIVIGSHIERREVWTKITPADLKKNDMLTVGVFTEVQKGDYVDWIPTIYGVEVDEWATWTDALTAGIVQYYNFDKSSGTALPDVTGNYSDGQLQNMTDGDWVAGILGNALNFDGTNDLVLLDNAKLAQTSTTYTYNAWFRMSDKLTTTGIISETSDSDGDTLLQMRTLDDDLDGFVRGDGGTFALIQGTDDVSSGWHMATLTRSGDNYELFVDGASEGTDTASIGAFDSDVALIGALRIVGNLQDHFKGDIDEVGLWNRTLTDPEIVDLYNGGTGITYPITGEPDVTLNSPIDNYNSTSNIITFNCTVFDDINLINVSLYINGTINETNSSGINNTAYTWTKTLAQGSANWTCEATDNEGKTTKATERSLSIDSLLPQITVSYPTGVISSGAIGANETLNVTFTDTNLDTCWYNYNGTNVTIAGCVTGVLNSTNFILETNNTNIIVYGNDTFGNENSETKSWSYNLTEVSQTYPTESIESATETYSANVNYNSSKYSVITGALTINGTQYLGTRTGTGDNATFSASAIMPTIAAETNFTAYWTIALTDASGLARYNLTSNNVTVRIINLSLCDAGNSVPFWNFTILNESNGAEINSTFGATFSVKQTGSTTTNEFSFSDTSGNNSQFDFCISPSTESYTIDTAIELTKTNFVNKFYNYEEIIVTNSTREDNLYMLASEDSTSFIIHTVTLSGIDITEAEVRVQRYYPGSGLWVTTEILTTNYQGEAVGHLLSEDADYRFLVFQSGVSTYNSSATKIVCAEAPCTVTLVIPDVIPTGYETVEDLTSTLTYNVDTNVFTYTYSDTSGDFTRARLYVVRVFPANATNVVPCNETKTDSSGVLTCDVSGELNGTYMADGYIIRDSDEFLDKRIVGVRGESIYNSIGVDGVLWSIFILIGIAMVGIARPSLAIIFGVVGIVTLSLLSIINIGTASIVGIVAIGVILLMRVGRE